MRNTVIRFFQKNNLTDTKEVNSLIASAFVLKNKLRVINNQLILDLMEFKFPGKEILQNELIEIVCLKNGFFNFENLIELFEFVISPSTRVVNGAVYTPKNIRTFIIKETLSYFDDVLLPAQKIADLSCGCGAFLIDSAEFLKKKTGLSYQHIFKNNIYGIDIEKYAIERSKILLSLLAISNNEDGNFDFNLIVGNSLTFDWKSCIQGFAGFNIIIGNPPYVTAKHMTAETRAQLTIMKTCQVGSPDLYIPFFEIGIENLADDGKLGFITMNSFFKSLNARNLRKYFKQKSLAFKLIDFGAEQVFQSRNTYTCICIISNITSTSLEYVRTKPTKLHNSLIFHKVPYQKLSSYHGWNLYANDIVNQIENTGISLGSRYKTSHGLATLKNEIYIFTPHKECDSFYSLITKEGKKYLIEKSICKPVINSNKLSRKSSVNALREQLIFPYTNEAKPKLISESFFRKNYPKSYLYLKEQKELLSLRDKGKGKYQEWYAFGRSQGLEQVEHKMFFPKYSDITPHYLIHSDPETYFYNGQAFLGDSIKELELLKKFLETRLFWFYITATSKPYASNYYSLNGIYIKNFGICKLTEEEESYVLSENNRDILDIFFAHKYSLDIKEINNLLDVN